MRQFQWAEYVTPVYKKYKLNITWGDQDIINIIFHFHPGTHLRYIIKLSFNFNKTFVDKLYIFNCEWNYRPDHCMYMNICKSAEANGVHILHGNRGVFHSENQPLFNQIYRTFDEYQLTSDVIQEFYLPLEYNIETTTHTNCGKLKNNFLKNVKKYLNFDQQLL